MTHSKKTGHRWLGMALGVAAVTVLSGCYDDAVVDVTGEKPAVNVTLGPGAALLPGGNLEAADLQILNPEGFDVTVADAFDRATGTTYQYFEDCCYAYTQNDVLTDGRDPRLPSVTASDVTVLDLGSGEFFYNFGPEAWNPGENIFNFWGAFAGVEPNTTLYLGMARYGVDVRGDLDQSNVLLGQPVTDPDSLVYAGGTPGGLSLRPADAFNRTTPYPAEPDANPYVFGLVQSNGNGAVVFDVVLSSFDAANNQVYYTDTDGFDASQSPVGPNELTEFNSNQYNYLVVWDQDPLLNPDAEPVLRIQMAADLDGNSLVPINNGFAPFPSGETDPAGFSDLPGAGEAYVAPTRLNLSFEGLPSLGSGGTYGVYLFEEEAGSFAFLTTFESAGPDETVEVSVTEQETEVDFSQYNRVLVSIEPGAPGGSPANAGFLFREFLTPNNALRQGAFTVGAGSVTPPEPFEIEGVGNGTFIRDSLLVELRRLAPPPAGFHYQSFLLDGTPDDFESAVRLHEIELNDLGNGVDRVGEDEVGSFANYNTYVVVLEPDVAPGITPAFIQVSADYIDQFGEDYFLDGTGGGDDD